MRNFIVWINKPPFVDPMVRLYDATRDPSGIRSFGGSLRLDRVARVLGSLIPPQSSPWLLTKFGEVFFFQPDGKIGMLQVSGFQYQIVAKDKTDFQEWLVDPDKLSEWFLGPLVDQLQSSGRTLGPDQCFSFITPLGLQGQLAAENVMIIPIREHFGCWGEVFQQIKNMPDGSQVVLKAT